MDVQSGARWEPLYETTQMKGDGEAHPFISPDDEFADFATWDKGQLGPEPETKEMLPREYFREALKRGLAYQAGLGVNPFRFGLIGSTDTHTSLSTTQEDNSLALSNIVRGRFGILWKAINISIQISNVVLIASIAASRSCWEITYEIFVSEVVTACKFIPRLAITSNTCAATTD